MMILEGMEMTDFEKAEKLREKADVSFADAKEALDNSGGDLLDAMIYLEKHGKSTLPTGGGYYSSAAGSAALVTQNTRHGGESGYDRSSGYDSFSDMLRRFGGFCMKMLTKGVVNFLDATKDVRSVFSCPVLAVILLLLFFFWIVGPLFVLSLFLGFRYRFRGPDLGIDPVNNVMDSASHIVEDVKHSFSERANERDRVYETDNESETEDTGNDHYI